MWFDFSVNTMSLFSIPKTDTIYLYLYLYLHTSNRMVHALPFPWIPFFHITTLSTIFSLTLSYKAYGFPLPFTLLVYILLVISPAYMLPYFQQLSKHSIFHSSLFHTSLSGISFLVLSIHFTYLSL